MKFLPHDPTKHEDLTLVPKGIFENIPEEELEELRQAGEWAWASDDQMILAPEQEQPFLYVVIKGSVRVFKTHFRSGREQPLADLYEGECFGEMAFLGEGKATAGVKARERALLWRLSHGTLLQYLSEYKGAGQMCLNLSAILAHRLKEGNSRLNGLAGGLSAYFGLSHLINTSNIELPSTGDPAEFEIPASVMDDFVRETLRMDEDEVVSMEAIQLVQEMIDDEKVDLVGWLDAGSAGHRLKMKIKFAQVDRDGNELEDVEYDTASCAVEVSSADTLLPPANKGAGPAKSAKGAKGKGGTAAKSSPSSISKSGKAPGKGKGARSGVGAASKSAKSKPRPMPMEEEEPPLLKKLIFPAACCFLAWLLMMIGILLIPGPTKAGWVSSEDGDINGFMRTLLFPTSSLPFGQAQKKWQEPFQWDLSKYAMEKAWMVVHFETKEALEEDLRVKVYLEGPDSTDNLLSGDKSNKVLKLKKGEKNWLLYDAYVAPDTGTDYTLTFDLMDYPDEDWEKDDAKMTIKVFR